MPVSTHMFSAWQRLQKGIGPHVTGVAVDDCKVVLEIIFGPLKQHSVLLITESFLQPQF